MKSTTAKILIFSFILSIIMVGGLMSHTLTQFESVKIKSENIVEKNNNKVELIGIMHNAARERLLGMLVMVNLEDEFMLDEVFMHFNQQGSVFARARYTLLEQELTFEEEAIIKKQGEFSNISVPIQREIVGLIENGDRASALELLNEKGIEAQNLVIEQFEKLVELQSASSQNILGEIDEQHNNSVQLIMITSVFALLFGSVLAYWVTYKITRTEKQLSLVNSELETRVVNRTKDLQTANTQLHESLSSLEAAQNQLVESEKMASLGTLVAGVAHEVNTPLGIGLTSSSLLQEKVDALKHQVNEKKLTQTALHNFMDEAKETCGILENNLYKAADLIANFKKLAVDQSSDQSYTFNLHETLHSSVVSLNHIMKKANVESSIEGDTGLTLFGNSGAVSQVVTNLITNSVTHGFDGVDDEKLIQIHYYLNEKDNIVVIVFHDNGKGMNKEVLAKIYEPFFTTKRGEGGSGLGLNLVYNLVNQKLKGKIQVDSEVGVGTTFTITLPKSINS